MLDQRPCGCPAGRLRLEKPHSYLPVAEINTAFRWRTGPLFLDLLQFRRLVEGPLVARERLFACQEQYATLCIELLVCLHGLVLGEQPYPWVCRLAAGRITLHLLEVAAAR